jgi:hypothetical protein
MIELRLFRFFSMSVEMINFCLRDFEILYFFRQQFDCQYFIFATSTP